MMKIGILTGDHTENGAGISNYITNLVAGMQDQPVELSIIRHPNGSTYGVKNQIVPWSPPQFGLMLWSCVTSLQRQKLSGQDLLHSPTLCLFPFKPHRRFVLTVHDLIFRKYPGYLPKGTVRHLDLFLGRNLQFSDRIIADSAATKQDLIALYHIPADKIRVISLAASPDFRPLNEETIAGIREKYSLDRPFILFVGTIEPRKNITTIIRALPACLEKYPDLELVVAGGKGWANSEVYTLVRSLGLEKNVRFLGYVPYEDLPGLYNAASVFVYPSLYEGFGFPPLEAMQCGTPVITSNSSSLPEVVGDGLTVDPDDHQAVSRLVIRLESDDAFRESVIRYGKERAALFSWKKTTEETMEVYREVLGR